MCTVRNRTNSFAALCNWISEFSNWIKERCLSNAANTPITWKNDEIRELSNSITELSK